MENHLKVLSQNTIALRHRVIHEQVILALDTLETQKVSEAFKNWQIREKCLSVMKLALESNNPSICSIGLQGIEYLVLHPDLDGIAGEEDLDSMDARIFVLQVLDSLNSLPSLFPEQQVFGLKILLGLCCDFVSSFDGELIIKIVQLCTATCSQEDVDTSVRCAAESLSSQAVEKLANADINGCKAKGQLADVIGLAKFFVQQIKHSFSNSQRGVHLECLLAVLKTLESSHVRNSEMFFGYVSRDLCPALATVISLNAMGAKVRLLEAKKKLRRRRKTKGVTVIRCSALHRKVAIISVELVRLVGCVASLRPHIALVFTHLLSPSTCIKHGIPFFVMNKLWATPEILFDLAGPFLVQDVNVKQNCTGILQLIIDAMLSLCDSKADGTINTKLDNIQSAVDSVSALLSTLDKARNGDGLREEQISRYFEKFDLKSLNEEDQLSDVDDDVILATETSEKVADDDLATESLSKNLKKADLSSYLSEEDDIWASSEDVYSALSSPSYQSAAEEEEQLSDTLQHPSPRLFGLMKYVSNPPASSSDSENDSTHSTCAGSDHTQEVDSVDDINNCVEEIILPKQDAAVSLSNLVDTAENTRNTILAQRHFSSIESLLPELEQCNDVAAVDIALQKAASNFCSEIYEKWKVDKIAVQADSLYVLSYSILELCYQLNLRGHYSSTASRLPCVKSQWVASQQSSGVYLSKPWLSETFRQIVTNNVFEGISVTEGEGKVCLLIEMLADIDGPGKQNAMSNGGNSTSFDDLKSPAQAGGEFAREIAVSVWFDLLQILQHPLVNLLDSKSDLSTSLFLFLSPSSLRDRTEKERDCIVSSLDSLRSAFKLSCNLGLHEYSSVVLSHMVDACVPKKYSQSYAPNVEGSEPKKEDIDMRLHICHVLCMESALDVAIEVGRHCSKSWEIIFRLVSYVSYLDHMCFHNESPNFKNCEEYLRSTSLSEVNIGDLVSENKIDVTWSSISSGVAQSTSMGFLTHTRTAKAVHVLSRTVDRIFEQASVDLDLRTLIDFVWSLCLASDQQLYSKDFNYDKVAYGTPLLYRLGECMLKCAGSANRPLMHVSHVWLHASLHFAKVLAHNSLHLAKQSATYIYNMTATVLKQPDETQSHHPLALWSTEEPKYFHFNESLLQPYERTMQTESCTLEIQELIIVLISQLVETSSKRICSGWRPLFSTLKHVTFNQDTIERTPVLEVLNAFVVVSEAPRVFASAANDCIKCLFNMLGSLPVDASKSCQPSFIIRYLEETANTLMLLHERRCEEKFSRFNCVDVTPSISGDDSLWKSLTVPKWISKENKSLDEVADELTSLTERCFSSNAVAGTSTLETAPTPPFGFSDKTGLLQTWFVLMDGLSTRALTTAHHVQPAVLNLLCQLLESSENTAGPLFSCHVLLHSCLPTLYSWLDGLNRATFADKRADVLTSYKHMFGTIMELTAASILKYLSASDVVTDTDEAKRYKNLIDKIWTSYLNLCIASLQTKKEPIAKLGCSCIRHIISTVGRYMTSSMLDDVCNCLNFLIEEGLSNLVSLVHLYEENVNTLEEMIVEVKENKSPLCDSSCLERVFQACVSLYLHKNTPHQEIYISSLHSSNKSFIRISLCDLACDILSTNLVVNCIESLLLGDLRLPWLYVAAKSQSLESERRPSETSSLHSTTRNKKNSSSIESERPAQSLLEVLSAHQVHELCRSVAKCFVAARSFDTHHDLQRLVQKLGKFYNAANLYQFAGSSFDIYLRIVLSVCCQHLNSFQSSFTENIFSSLHHSINSSNRVSLSDFMAKLEYEDNGDSLKPPTDVKFALEWAFHSLHRSMLFLSHAWGSIDSLTSSASDDLFVPGNDNDVSCDPKEEEQNEKEKSPPNYPSDINCDYMAYVKKTDSTPITNGRSSGNAESHRQKHHQPDRHTSNTSREKVLGRLIDAYKRRSRSKSSLSKTSYENETNNNSSSARQRKSRTSSESSSVSSTWLAFDDRVVERQVWASTVTSTLKLLTSAPDPVLSRLLPVIYCPIAGLANHSSHSSLLLEENGNDVGEAFYKWLLRVGDLCNFSPVISSN